ncbi:hypothetical protein phytr_2750 [Candidatus Phycorickettsia trachydisci]|uniref:Uncharacterized protein n=1 Tax=Candidatus Phycorickettsia trachydisci TaxID=2115978 RepID=A0A2P1P7J0_9RICK|nr:hypothetical protein [Candidatus Phycorickettsia trachydisci]AVP87231.1 hypothetical protein phytr_2750 [Candidatus Phycorickettsia trachydisci]
MNVRTIATKLFKPSTATFTNKSAIIKSSAVPSTGKSAFTQIDKKYINSFRVFNEQDHWRHAEYYAQKSKESAIEAKTALFKIPSDLNNNLGGIGSQGVAALKSIPTVGGGLFAAKLGVSLMPNFLLKSVIQLPINCMFSNPFLTTLGLMGFQIAKEPKYLKDTTKNVGKVLYHTPASLYNASQGALEASKASMMPKKYNTFVYGEEKDSVVVFPALCENKGEGVKEYSIYKDMKPGSEFIGQVDTDTFEITDPALQLLGNPLEDCTLHEVS